MKSLKPENIYAGLLQVLKSEEIGVTPELRLKLNEKLKKVSAEKRNSTGNLKIILAFAASVLVVISGMIIISYDSNDKSIHRTLVHESTVGSQKPVTIKLRYNSKEDLENVAFSIDLDEGVAFFSKDPSISELRSHTWKGSLKKGENEIPFVVKTSRNGIMKIKTEAKYSDFSFTHEIVLDAQESSVSVSMFLIETAKIR